MQRAKEIDDAAEEGNDDAEADVDFYADAAADFGEEEVEGVEEEGGEAGHEEDVVPLVYEFASGVEDLVPPRLLVFVY